MEKQESVRYNLTIPADLYRELQAIADEQKKPVSDVLRHAIKWELLFDSVKRENGRVFVQKTENSKRQEILLM